DTCKRIDGDAGGSEMAHDVFSQDGPVDTELESVIQLNVNDLRFDLDLALTAALVVADQGVDSRYARGSGGDHQGAGSPVQAEPAFFDLWSGCLSSIFGKYAFDRFRKLLVRIAFF